MKSDLVKKGVERAPHRSLFKAMGYTDAEIKQPLIGIANSVNTIIPGHVHLDKIVEAVKAGVYMAGGTPIEFGVIGVCDGIAMNHEGMKYSLASRELIADSIEVMATAHAFDALVLVPNCDKIVPGMLMAAARLNLPAIVISIGFLVVNTVLMGRSTEGWDFMPAAQATPGDFGVYLFQTHWLAVEIASMLLLVALVGAYVLGLRVRRRPTNEAGEEGA